MHKTLNSWLRANSMQRRSAMPNIEKTTARVVNLSQTRKYAVASR